MKPPKKYTEWLQAHPAVWEALQEEWEPTEGDRFALGDYIGLVTHPWANDSSKREGAMWLPTLGQLTRMLEETECGFSLYSPDIEDDELEYTLTSYKIVDFDMNEDEPEIACTALWAKVKGINV